MVQCGAKRSFDSEVLGWSFMVQKVVGHFSFHQSFQLLFFVLFFVYGADRNGEYVCLETKIIRNNCLYSSESVYCGNK